MNSEKTNPPDSEAFELGTITYIDEAAGDQSDIDIARGIFSYKEVEYPFVVKSKDLYPSVQYFVGFSKNKREFLLSEEVPEDQRALYLAHEAECLFLRTEEGRCMKIERDILNAIMRTDFQLAHEYANTRKQMYTTLNGANKSGAVKLSGDIPKEVATAMDYYNIIN